MRVYIGIVMDVENWRPITLLGVDYKLPTKALGERLKGVLPNLIHKDQNGFVPGGNIFFSVHKIRDIIFYCSEENVNLVMLPLDYAQRREEQHPSSSSSSTAMSTRLY